MAEWSSAAVLKNVVLRGTRGSNPCLSAELTGQNRKMNSQVSQIQRFVGFFYPLMSALPDIMYYYSMEIRVSYSEI